MANKVVKTFRLDADVVRKIEALAKEENRSLNNMVDTLFRRYAKEHYKEPLKIRVKAR